MTNRFRDDKLCCSPGLSCPACVGDDVCGEDADCECRECLNMKQPPPGSWADIARMMSQGDDSGFDWDAWKDEQKMADWDR